MTPWALAEKEWPFLTTDWMTHNDCRRSEKYPSVELQDGKEENQPLNECKKLTQQTSVVNTKRHSPKEGKKVRIQHGT